MPAQSQEIFFLWNSSEIHTQWHLLALTSFAFWDTPEDDIFSDFYGETTPPQGNIAIQQKSLHQLQS